MKVLGSYQMKNSFIIDGPRTLATEESKTRDCDLVRSRNSDLSICDLEQNCTHVGSECWSSSFGICLVAQLVPCSAGPGWQVCMTIEAGLHANALCRKVVLRESE